MNPKNILRLSGAALLGGLLLAFTPALSAQSASTYVASAGDKFRDGDYDGAIADYTKALDLNSSYLGAYNGRGLARCNQGNFDGAIADFSAAIKLKPALADAYFNRGTAEFLQGNFDAANADCTKVIELKPGSQAAYFHRGLVRDGEANFEGARTEYAKALELKPANEETAEYLVLYGALLNQRLGLGNDARLKAAVGWSNAWTKALAMFLNGQITESELLNRARADDSDVQKQQLAEACYFAGALKGIAGNKPAGKADLQRAFDGSSPAELVHRMARVELDRN